MLFIVTALMVKTYEVVRIPLWMELFYAIGFIGVIMAVSKVALPFIIKINNNFLKLLSEINIFYFYISQALFFTVMVFIGSDKPTIVNVFLVLCCSLVFSYVARYAETYLKSKL